MTKEIPFFIKKKQNNEMETKIPRNIIQTYKNNDIHNFIYNNIMNLLSINQDFNYYFITDDIGIDLIKTHFDEHTLEAFNRLNLGASKGDFLRYISIYVYGCVYLDLDSNINISLSSFIDSNIEHLFFMDYSKNIQQWCFMVSQKNGIICKIIQTFTIRQKRYQHMIEVLFLCIKILMVLF
jgi:mannosyltransferase OCH1-like enzyme